MAEQINVFRTFVFESFAMSDCGPCFTATDRTEHSRDMQAESDFVGVYELPEGFWYDSEAETLRDPDGFPTRLYGQRTPSVLFGTDQYDSYYRALRRVG